MLSVSSPKEISFRENTDAVREPRRELAVSAGQLTFFHWLLIVTVAVFATRIMWAPALLAGHSAWLDFTRMVEFDAAIRAGDYLPTWSPDLYHGYGSPLFQFYSPLVYYVTEIPVLAGMQITSALKITQLFMLIASGVTMYHLATAHVSRWAACFGAVLYMIAPYRMADIFVRHALAEHAAFVWLPLIVWGTERFASQRTRTGLIIGALATAGLLLTHNVMALIGLPVCVAAGWLLSARKNWATFFLAGCPAVIGIGLASFYWWPALSGRALTQAETSLTSGHFDFHNHFLSASDTAWQIGLPHLLVGLAAIVLIFTKWRTWSGAAGTALTTLALFMCLSASLPIWNTLPLLKYVQFPWRFLGLAVFGTAICGAMLFERIRTIQPRLELPVFLAGLVVVMAAYFPYSSEARFQALDSQTSSLAQVTSERVVAMRESGVLLSLDQIVTPAKMREVGERGTSSDDFLPRGVEEKPPMPALEPIVINNGEIRQWERTALNHYRASVSMREAGKVELQQFWFPGWTAKLDGHAIDAAPSGKAAIVSCNIPIGDHSVEFEYTALPQRQIGLIASCVSMALAGAACFIFRNGGAL